MDNSGVYFLLSATKMLTVKEAGVVDILLQLIKDKALIFKEKMRV